MLNIKSNCNKFRKKVLIIGVSGKDGSFFQTTIEKIYCGSQKKGDWSKFKL